jgi:hypothetical protein
MKKLFILTLSVFFLFSCSSNKKNENNKADDQTSTEEVNNDTPLIGKIKEVKFSKNSADFLVVVEGVVDEKIEPNLFFTKLVDDEGLECGVELMDSKQPLFNFKTLYKGDKTSGWLSFKYPNSKFKPSKIVFTKVVSNEILCEIPVGE